MGKFSYLLLLNCVLSLSLSPRFILSLPFSQSLLSFSFHMFGYQGKIKALSLSYFVKLLVSLMFTPCTRHRYILNMRLKDKMQWCHYSKPTTLWNQHFQKSQCKINKKRTNTCSWFFLNVSLLNCWNSDDRKSHFISIYYCAPAFFPPGDCKKFYLCQNQMMHKNVVAT